MPEEGVRRDLELEHVAAAMPRSSKDVAPEDRVLGLRRSERAEVVLAEQEVCCVGESLLLEWPWIPPSALGLERRRLATAPDAIAIAA